MSKNSAHLQRHPVSKIVGRPPIHKNKKSVSPTSFQGSSTSFQGSSTSFQNYSTSFQEKFEDVDNVDDDESAPENQALYPDLTNELENVVHPRALEELSTSQGQQNHSDFYMYMIYLVIIVGVLSCSVKFFSSQSPPIREFYDVSKLIQEMQSKFSEQPQLTFRVVKTALRKVTNESIEPTAPAVITLIVDQGAMNTALKFSKHIAQYLAPGRYIMIDKTVYGDKNPDDAKLEIDTKISKLKDDTLNVVIVDKLDSIPFDAAMIFHSYCDHGTAQFKRVVYLLILSLNEVLDQDSESNLVDKAATNHIKHLWHNKHPDEIDSFITRITVSVVNIKKNHNLNN